MNIAKLLFRFGGRIGRGQFWTAYLPVLVAATASDIFLKFGIMPDLRASDGPPTLEQIAMLLTVSALLFVLAFAAFAILAKRWHDRDKSGWWSLITIIPIVGTIWIVVECGFLRGTTGPNRFGPDPLA